MTDRVVIRRADNGWTVEGHEVLYAFGEGHPVDLWAEALGAITELMGPTTSRHDAKRVYITVHPGDKHDDFKNELL